MDEYKVTIGILAYKVEQYLVECLTTALRQTYQNLEILVVDDASPDNCAYIADTFAERDSRVRVIHKKENEGLAAARNTILDEMTGDLLYWLDGDDYLEDTAVETAVHTMIHDGSDIVKTIIREQEDAYTGIYSKDEFMHILLPNTIQSNVIGCLFKKELYRGIRHTEGMVLEDYETMPLLADRAERISVIKRGPYGYRVARPGSITTQGARCFKGYHPRAVWYAQRYELWHKRYPEECKTVLQQFADYGCMACLYAKDGDNLLDIRKNMTSLERVVMIAENIHPYKKWLYRAIISNSKKIKLARVMHKLKGKLGK